MQRLILIRHAETEDDWPLRFAGRSDPDLSLRGREEAALIAGRHPESAGLEVWSSPMLRAMTTARLAFPDRLVHPEPLALELDFGVVEGLLPDEAAQLYPEAWARLQRSPFDCNAAAGETGGQLRRRAKRLKAKLEKSGSLILISHQQILSALIEVLTGRQPAQALGYARGALLERREGGGWRSRDDG